MTYKRFAHDDYAEHAVYLHQRVAGRRATAHRQRRMVMAWSPLATTTRLLHRHGSPPTLQKQIILDKSVIGSHDSHNSDGLPRVRTCIISFCNVGSDGSAPTVQSGYPSIGWGVGLGCSDVTIVRVHVRFQYKTYELLPSPCLHRLYDTSEV